MVFGTGAKLRVTTITANRVLGRMLQTCDVLEKKMNETARSRVKNLLRQLSFSIYIHEPRSFVEQRPNRGQQQKQQQVL